MSDRPARIATILLVGWLAATPWAVAGDSPLSLADLEAYRVALSSKPDGSAPLVEFRDLWDRPDEYVGKTVSVEGRLARFFRQPRFGDFPPLVEAWVVSPAGDPFCLVFPQVDGGTIPELGALVRFSGTFLKRIEYQGGDVARLAPLIVGPVAVSNSNRSLEMDGLRWSTTDWMMALGACLVVGLVLAGRHLSRPDAAPRPLEPPPSFVDGEAESEGDSHETGR